jgi:hypothetical protein
MAGMEDPRTTADARWTKAERYAHGYADNGMGKALRVYYTRYLPLGTLAIVLLLSLLGPIVIPAGPDQIPTLVQAGWFIFAITALVGGLVYNTKRLKPRVELGANVAVTFPLEKDEQKALMRGINGKEPVPANHLAVARAVAVRSRKDAATTLLIVPAYTYFIGQAVGNLDWVYLAFFVAFAVLAVLQVSSFRRQGRFLAATAPPAT